jgi:hypothetical protein
MTVTSAEAPRKAYRVEVTGQAVKSLLVYATSAQEANRTATDDRHGPNVVVMDTTYGETGIRRSATRRCPSEDRP